MNNILNDVWFHRVKLLPLYLLYVCTFALAGGSKILGGGVPEWFSTQFGPTILNAFPGALALNFYLIAALECLVVVGMTLSLLRAEFLPRAPRPVLLSTLLLAEVVFVILGFGLRLTNDFNGAASLFSYFAGTLLVLWYVERVDSPLGRH